MNELALSRLKESGWTADRHVDYSEIEKAYSDNGLEMPDELREFFDRFAFLKIVYILPNGKIEKHFFNPVYAFWDNDYDYFSTIFNDYNIFGTAYPMGSVDEEMTLYYHDNGNYYLYMDGGPLICIGDSLDIMMDNLIGCIVNNWRYID